MYQDQTAGFSHSKQESKVAVSVRNVQAHLVSYAQSHYSSLEQKLPISEPCFPVAICVTKPVVQQVQLARYSFTCLISRPLKCTQRNNHLHPVPSLRGAKMVLAFTAMVQHKGLLWMGKGRRGEREINIAEAEGGRGAPYSHDGHSPYSHPLGQHQ